MGGILVSGKKVIGVVSYVIFKGEQKNYILVYNLFFVDIISSNIEERVKDDIDYLVKLDQNLICCQYVFISGKCVFFIVKNNLKG